VPIKGAFETLVNIVIWLKLSFSYCYPFISLPKRAHYEPIPVISKLTLRFKLKNYKFKTICVKYFNLSIIDFSTKITK
jgi:hypothetical protein